MKIRYVLLFLSYAYIFNSLAMDNQEIENNDALGYFPAINQKLNEEGYLQLIPDHLKKQIMHYIKEPYADFKDWLTAYYKTIYNYDNAIEVSFTEDKQWCEVIYKDYSIKIFNMQNKNEYSRGFKEYNCIPYVKKTYAFKDGSTLTFFPENSINTILLGVEQDLENRDLAELSIIKKIYDSYKKSLSESEASVILLDEDEQKTFDALPRHFQESLSVLMTKKIENE